MQYELRYQVIEPKRHTYQNVIDRLGDQPASRYLEGTLDVQPKENFHYRPTWIQDRELYDARYSALVLTDPYSFLDPRQYYYTPYVTNRAAHHEEFGKTLGYLEKRDLLAKMPDPWRAVLGSVIVPLRHFESGAQLITVNGARFAHGTSLSQCCTYAAFDRIGNAQQLSRIGIALGGGTGELLAVAKTEWMEGEHLQPLRKLVEHVMLEQDWAEGVLAVDLIDSLLYPVLYSGLDDAALLGGAGAYSLVGQHFTSWFADQRKWLDAAVTAWVADADNGATNARHLRRITDTWLPQALEAVTALTDAIDGELPEANSSVAVTAAAAVITARLNEALGATA